MPMPESAFTTADAARFDAVPAWLESPQNHEPQKDRERFLTRNMLKLTALLSHMKLQRGGLDSAALSPIDRALSHVDCSFRVFGLIVTAVCISLASNMFFVYTMAGVYLCLLALKPGWAIIDCLKTPLAALALTVVIMAPAIFIGQPTSMVRVGLKVFVTVGFVIALSRDVAYNQLIAGLRTYHVPGLVIFVLDITLKYIVMLGDVARDVLEALTLRSVGRNRDKQGASGGVMGVTFLKAHDFSAEMYEAMECRGFTGDYVVPKRKILSSASVLYLLAVAGEVLYLLVLEGVIL